MSEDVQELNELLVIRRSKLDELKALGVDPFGSKYERTHSAQQILDAYEGMSKEELEALHAEVSLAGRIMQKKEGWGKRVLRICRTFPGKFKFTCVKTLWMRTYIKPLNCWI